VSVTSAVGADNFGAQACMFNGKPAHPPKIH
jgi:hypothetical protein